MAEKKDTRVWLNSVISPMLVAKDGVSEYGDKLQELRTVAETIAPSGRLVCFLSSEKEKFFKYEKLIANLAAMRSIYNEGGFMRDPTLAEEFSEISKHIKAINSIIDKRKSKRGKRKWKNN